MLNVYFFCRESGKNVEIMFDLIGCGLNDICMKYMVDLLRCF